MGTGVDDRVGAKSLHEADDEDTRGCRHLFGGIFMAMHALLRLEHLGKPRSGQQVGQRCGCYVVTSFETSPRLFMEFSVHHKELALAPLTKRASMALCTPSPTLFG
jgi:hypothetical protein